MGGIVALPCWEAINLDSQCYRCVFLAASGGDQRADLWDLKLHSIASRQDCFHRPLPLARYGALLQKASNMNAASLSAL